MGDLEFHAVSVKEKAESITQAIEAHGSVISALSAWTEVLTRGDGK